ncbi:MAG: hypothetical protein VCA36_08130 [Opitutales bacterium]
MNDLEKELRSLEPRSPSEEFETGLEKALGEAGKVAVKHMPEMSAEMETTSSRDLGAVTSSGFFQFVLFAGVAAALAFALYLLNPFSNTETKVSQTPPLVSAIAQDLSPLHGVSASSIAAFSDEGWNDPETRQILVDAADEGIVNRPGLAPARRYRYRYLDETVWRHPATNTLIHSAVPREEVILVGLDPY